MVQIKISTLPHYEGLPLPAYQTPQAAGLDLLAAQTASLPAGGRMLIGTGIALELPFGYEAQVRPRSGLAVKAGVTLLNSPGTIDADYRGEIKVLLINFGEDEFFVERGMRIAQLVVVPVSHVELLPVTELTETKRGSGGFGHTGL